MPAVAYTLLRSATPGQGWCQHLDSEEEMEQRKAIWPQRGTAASTMPPQKQAHCSQRLARWADHVLDDILGLTEMLYSLLEYKAHLKSLKLRLK